MTRPRHFGFDSAVRAGTSAGIWTLTRDIDAFQAAVEEYLVADPVRCTVLLTVADRVRGQGPFAYGGELPARFGWWRRSTGAAVEGAFVHAPPHRPDLGPMPDEAARALARSWRADPVAVDGVNGDVGAARSLATAWAEEDGRWSVARKEQLYRLGELILPGFGPDEGPRLAMSRDLPLLLRWFGGFAAEAADAGDLGGTVGAALGALVTGLVEVGQVVLWEVNGRAVSMARFSSLVSGMGRVESVYTPPQLRGHGYASGAVAAASAALLTAGADDVLLIADRAALTGDDLYTPIGFRPVAERAVLDFHR